MESLSIDALQQVVVNSLSELGMRIAGFLPSFVGMLVILLVGWIIARIASGVATRILVRAGLDRAANRLGLNETLEQAGLVRAPSGLIGRLLYWVLMLTFVLSAVETLGLTAVTQTIDRLISFLPNIIAASLIVIVGLLIARFIGNLVGSGAAAADMPYARQLGSSARGAMIIMVSILALEQLGVDAAILLWAVITVLAAISIGLGLAFALGSRDVVGAILAGYYLRKSLAERSVVTIDGKVGTLDRIGPVHTMFNTDQGVWSVPNQELLKTHIHRR